MRGSTSHTIGKTILSLSVVSCGDPCVNAILGVLSSATITRRDVDMGAIAEGIVAYAQPLLDQTDGSEEQLNKALTLSQVCWNLSLLPEDEQDQMISEMRSSLQMEEDEFAEFRRAIIDPMIRRHQEMFPLM